MRRSGNLSDRKENEVSKVRLSSLQMLYGVGRLAGRSLADSVAFSDAAVVRDRPRQICYLIRDPVGS